jgi:hypothetical protein
LAKDEIGQVATTCQGRDKAETGNKLTSVPAIPQPY